MEFILSIERWIHLLAGITWIGLLYYFNFVQVPAMAAAAADKDGPGPAAIGKYVAPRALLWFRWSALVTWLSGASYLEAAPQFSFVDAFLLQGGSQIIGVGAWLGTIMLFNVWVLIWPNQKKILGMVEATDEERTRQGASRCWHRAATPRCRFPCCCSWGRRHTGYRFSSADTGLACGGFGYALLSSPPSLGNCSGRCPTSCVPAVVSLPLFKGGGNAAVRQATGLPAQ